MPLPVSSARASLQPHTIAAFFFARRASEQVGRQAGRPASRATGKAVGQCSAPTIAVAPALALAAMLAGNQGWPANGHAAAVSTSLCQQASSWAVLSGAVWCCAVRTGLPLPRVISRANFSLATLRLPISVTSLRRESRPAHHPPSQACIRCLALTLSLPSPAIL